MWSLIWKAECFCCQYIFLFVLYTRLTYNSKNRQDDKAGHGLQKGSLVIDRSNTVLSHHAWSQNNTMLKAKMFSARLLNGPRSQRTRDCLATTWQLPFARDKWVFWLAQSLSVVPASHCEIDCWDPVMQASKMCIPLWRVAGQDSWMLLGEYYYYILYIIPFSFLRGIWCHTENLLLIANLSASLPQLIAKCWEIVKKKTYKKTKLETEKIHLQSKSCTLWNVLISAVRHEMVFVSSLHHTFLSFSFSFECLQTCHLSFKLWVNVVLCK